MYTLRIISQECRHHVVGATKQRQICEDILSFAAHDRDWFMMQSLCANVTKDDECQTVKCLRPAAQADGRVGAVGGRKWAKKYRKWYVCETELDDSPSVDVDASARRNKSLTYFSPNSTTPSVSAKLHYTDTGYGRVVQHHQRTSSQQFYNLLYNKFVTS